MKNLELFHSFCFCGKKERQQKFKQRCDLVLILFLTIILIKSNTIFITTVFANGDKNLLKNSLKGPCNSSINYYQLIEECQNVTTVCLSIYFYSTFGLLLIF